MELIDIIRQAIQQSLSAAQLTDYRAGEVTSTTPLMISISPTMPPIQSPSILLTTAVTNPGLSVGDRVLLLRVNSGQKFIVLSRVVDP